MLNTTHSSLLLKLMVFYFLSIGSVTSGFSESLPPTPEIPIIMRDVATVPANATREKNVGNDFYTYPVIPPFNTTLDGRVALSMESHRLNKYMEWNVMNPEQIDHSIVDSSNPGSLLFSHESNYRLSLFELENIIESIYPPESIALRLKKIVFKVLNKLPEGNLKKVALEVLDADFKDIFIRSHPGICEDHERNPRNCDGNDCYDVNVIFFTKEPKPQYDVRYRRIWKVPMTIVIRNPKTAAAAIKSIEIHEDGIQGTDWMPFNVVFEPVVTRDGKLLVARAEGSNFTWKRSALDPVNPGGEVKGKYDMFFAYSEEPCDIFQWAKNYYPLAYAQSHPIVKSRYGFAHYPFQDAEGNSIPDTVDIKGTYPWVDREGNNVFFSLLNTSLYYRDGDVVKSQYPADCLPDVQCIDPIQEPEKLESAENFTGFSGFGMMGLWTHGKVVLLDGVLSHTDFTLRVPSKDQRLVSLYEPDSGPNPEVNQSGKVRVAAGRDEVAHMLKGVDNTTIPNSIQNVFNYYEHMRPVTPRDIVWIMTKGHVTDEVIFDDYIDPNVLIFSEMTASWTQENDTYHNGWDVYDQEGTGFTHEGGNWSIHLQNSATTTQLEIPAYGEVWGAARVEPVALGGVRGRGFWMTSGTQVKYAIPTGLNNQGWYLGIFVDTRATDNAWRSIFKIPGANNVVAAIHAQSNRLGLLQWNMRTKNYDIIGEVELPRSLIKQWRHLGFYFSNSGAKAHVYLDGNRIQTFTAASGTFNLKEGGLVLAGGEGGTLLKGFKGWIDEFKVIIDYGQFTNTAAEIFCNHAHGTMVGMNNRTATNASLWDSVRNSSIMGYVSNELISRGFDSYRRYACLTDYTADYQVSVREVPKDTDSLRQMLLFPEGPLVWNKPRPDSSGNNFCKTCHINSSDRPVSLTPVALEPHPGINMTDDGRRQPSQPPKARGHNHPLVFGNIPVQRVKGLDGQKLPAETMNAIRGYNHPLVFRNIFTGSIRPIQRLEGLDGQKLPAEMMDAIDGVNIDKWVYPAAD